MRRRNEQTWASQPSKRKAWVRDMLVEKAAEYEEQVDWHMNRALYKYDGVPGLQQAARAIASDYRCKARAMRAAAKELRPDA